MLFWISLEAVLFTILLFPGNNRVVFIVKDTFLFQIKLNYISSTNTLRKLFKLSKDQEKEKLSNTCET